MRSLALLCAAIFFCALDTLGTLPPMTQLPEMVDGLPNICGAEAQIEAVLAEAKDKKIYASGPKVDFARARATTAIALHMHQPLIPAGGNDLRTARLISNLEAMWNNMGTGDNHNAPVFHWCYKRMGEFLPKLVDEGKQPRVMLEYSGTLFYGLRAMGKGDALDALREVTTNPRTRHTLEWLGCPWGHAVAPSTPAQDYRLHVTAWQQHFASIFGLEALGRVRGFSPSEMALPNHPDVAYHFIKTLRDCGFTWVLVQEHTVEQPHNGHGPEKRHLPHRLVCRSSTGEEVSIIAIIKTQGSDTKLVAQMQPYYEAKSLTRWELAGKSVPPLVTQIADGENGGVMMNEFPGKFHDVVREAAGSDVPMVNVTEYLEALFEQGITEADLPVVQPLFQKRIWERFKAGDGPEKLKQVIDELRKEDHRFHVEGGSWTSNISWVKGYDNVLGPMEQASVRFHEKMLATKMPRDSKRFREALFLLLSSQTSCYRYWGQGVWTDYGKELCRRAIELCGA